MQITKQFDKQKEKYPLIFRDVEAFLQGKEDRFALCMRYLYGHMPAQDVLSLPVERVASYAWAALNALEQLEYAGCVPQEIFYPYVLYHRVNSEEADGSRSFLQQELLPFVRGKTLEEAALAVNYWCYAHATYIPADERTLGPMGVLRRTLGRCGEESVLAVAAMRSVGIPARQCYCPRWSHCDDNHAWVEVWVEGAWRYLGACEPEPVLDRGWFTAAASRAMLVDTKCWAGEGLYQRVNCTSRYAPTRNVKLRVLEEGVPAAHARVCFQVINYSESFTLWETETDENGDAEWETGLGSLLVFAQKGEKVALEALDLRQSTFWKLELKDSFPELLEADLVPPEDVSGVVPYLEDEAHLRCLGKCEAHLREKRANFEQNAGWLGMAAGNAAELQAFLEECKYPQSQKEGILSTLRPKDFCDVTREVLFDALEAAAPARGRYPEDIFINYILAPRIGDEMLLPQRQKIRALFPGGFASPSQILAWMEQKLQLLPTEGVDTFYPSAYGCLKYRQVPEFAFDYVFVAACRAFGFPARLEETTGQGQWLEETWHFLHPQKPPVKLTLELPEGERLNYFEHITLGYWKGRGFTTLAYPELTLEGSHSFSVQPGLYRITLTTRQIDGTASVVLHHLRLTRDTALQLMPPEDQTPSRLKRVELTLPEGAVRHALESTPGKKAIVIFADPGSEPTEHLLTEIKQLEQRFSRLDSRLLFVLPNHKTLEATLPGAELLEEDPAALAALHRQMQVGDLRLPFVVCLDSLGRGIYASANYQIRLAGTLAQIQSLSEASPAVGKK